MDTPWKNNCNNLLFAVNFLWSSFNCLNVRFALSVWMLALSLLSQASCGHIQKSRVLRLDWNLPEFFKWKKFRNFSDVDIFNNWSIFENVFLSLHLSEPSAPDCTVCCLLLDACPVLPSQLDNATNTATPNTQVFTEHQVTDSQFHSFLFFSRCPLLQKCVACSMLNV